MSAPHATSYGLAEEDRPRHGVSHPSPCKRICTLTLHRCSPGGIGHALAKEFHSRGLQVFATVRTVDKISDLKELGIVDEIVKEPEGGAHTDLEAAAQFLDEVLDRQMIELTNEPVKALVEARYKKFRQMGQFFDIQA